MPDTEKTQSFSQVTLGNIAWNFIGQLLVGVLAFFAMPYIVHKLGVELYALYGLLGVIIGYFSFLRLGLGTASIKFIAAHLAKREDDQVRTVFWTSLCAHGVLGVAGMALIAGLSPFLARHFLKIPLALQETALIVLYLAAIGFLVAFIMSVMGSVIQAAGRFDILNKIGIVLGISQLAGTVFLLKIGFSLKAVVISGIVIQIGAICWYWYKLRCLFPYITQPKIERRTLLELFAFGGFVTLSSIVGPFLLNAEKIFLTSFVSLSSLTYYLIPFAVTDTFSIIRSSFSSALLPAFSYLHEVQEKSASVQLHLRSSLAIFFMYAFFVLFFVILGKPFLFYWMGNDFAERSAAILAILSVAALIGALAAPSFVALQGLGKPQIPAIFHIIETVLYVPGCYFLIKFFGLLGAAEAWFWRTAIDAALILCASCRLLGINIAGWCASFMLRAFAPVLVCSILLIGMRSWRIPLLSFAGIAGVALTFGAYVLSVWLWGLDGLSREKVRIFLKGMVPR